MQKITFENLPSTNTPVSAQNLNLLQENVEDAIDEAGVIVSATEPVTDRRKIWLQHGANIKDKVYILNSNDVYEAYDDIEEFTLSIPSAQSGTYYQAFKKGRLAGITADIRINGITGNTIINLGTVPNEMKPYLNNAVTSMIVIDGGGHPVDYGWAMVNTEGTIRIQAINTSSNVRILAFSLTYLTN